MKQLFKWVGLILVAAGVGLALAFIFTANVRSQPSIDGLIQHGSQTAPYPSNQFGGYGPGMMWQGKSGVGSWGMGPGMMGGGYRPGILSQPYPGNNTPITIDQAVEAANQYVSAFGNSDLTLTEVMEFSDNFYAEVKEKSTGIHTFEVLIDRYTAAVYPEPGPNMMWNTRYSPMAGMMGGWGIQQAEAMSITSEQALGIAQQWLDQSLPGTSTAGQADTFYGYYTIHILKNNQIYGMLSVNGFTGDVWYHTWHGDFINMKELDE